MRREFDFYETAPWQVDALVDHVPEAFESGTTIMCPCVGDGSIWKRLIELKGTGHFLAFSTNDIDKTRFADYHFDARLPDYYVAQQDDERIAVDWAVENPPFNIEIDILIEAYKHVRYGVIFMSRLSFLEPTDDYTRKGVTYTGRGPWLKAHPLAKQIVLQRYSFTGDGASDSVTTAWNVWLKPGVQISNPGVFSAYGYKPR